MNPADALLLAACLTACALSGLALLLLAKPNSALSRLVDRPAGDTTDRKALR